ncbi:MAG: mechanosensitive ion channel domain-containing protein [Candidatus Electrothrix sp. GW3-4]|uniref:mechanosensitive ion channel family protein n=1 Tax=Candidatus Electrothrix sp. GW3-4 TaxID=3126740 RepID=UPI0030CBF712
MSDQPNLLIAWLEQAGLSHSLAVPLTYTLIIFAVFLAALLATWLVRRFVVSSLIKAIHNNRLSWDDALTDHHFFTRLSWFVPVLIFYVAQDILLPPDSQWLELVPRLIFCGFILAGIRTISALLKATNSIYRFRHLQTGKTIRGYIDAIRIVVYLFGAIFMMSTLTGRSPWGLLSVMGGLTALTMLIFRDTILGFIGAIQLTTNDMIRVGDWIEMASHGADGDVIEVSIHSVRVRNWNKTITTIPTYALIANPFKNWRGMTESGGRRIKRALHLDMTSIRFLSEEELDKLGEIRILRDYLHSKREEIKKYNRARGAEASEAINGRCQTNAGLFRAYIVAWLQEHPKIHKKMTFLVRQLAPGPNGLPMEIYVFSNDQVWANYEALQADIFDHLISILPYFHLRVFQEPSGYDFKVLAHPPQKSAE